MESDNQQQQHMTQAQPFTVSTTIAQNRFPPTTAVLSPLLSSSCEPHRASPADSSICKFGSTQPLTPDVSEVVEVNPFTVPHAQTQVVMSGFHQPAQNESSKSNLGSNVKPVTGFQNTALFHTTGQPAGFGHGFGTVFSTKNNPPTSELTQGPEKNSMSPGRFFRSAAKTSVDAKPKDAPQLSQIQPLASGSSMFGKTSSAGQSWAAILGQSSGQQPQFRRHDDDLHRPVGLEGQPPTRELVNYSDVTTKQDYKKPTFQKLFKERALSHTTADKEVATKISVSDPVIRRGVGSPDKPAAGSPEGPDKLTVIIVKEIPGGLCNRHFLSKHFSRFGSIVKTYVRSEKNHAYITFERPEEAQKAKKHGGVLERNGKPVPIFLKSRSSSRRSVAEKRGEASLGVKAAGLGVKERVQRVPTSSVSSLPLKMKAETGARERRQQLAQAHSLPQQVPSGLTNRDPDQLTAGEVVQILEERDKIMIQAMAQKADLKSAKATVGSCSDMCPDKERYIRQERRYLSPFEILVGTENTNPPQVDHTRAVKEYNRSAADKKDPLPHELRPAHVLDMTMNYLMNNIMDQGEGRWAEWYDFVWNRTRGIRKDVTQQHICDVTATHLIEKCTRFHIHCAHRLSECDMATFDSNINTENMTKCIQSLKHFYYDLGTEGQYSEFEAEFRAYELLLNLNENDILREVQQLRPVVRDSPEMKFALKCFFAVNSKNYVHFFRLVRSATYLSACLLHRYFLQVRVTGLQILKWSYSCGKAVVPYPLTDLMRILAFENRDEAVELCEHYGISVQDDQVQFSRQPSVEPQAGLSQKRALKLIESKKKCSVGEMVNGGPLPPNVIHVPTLKLDTPLTTVSSGQLNKSSTDSQIHVKSHPAQSTTDPVDYVKMERVPVKNNEEVKKKAKDFINSELREILLEISEEEISHQHRAEGVVYDVFNSLCSDLMPQMITEAANQQMETEMAVLLKQRREMAQASFRTQLDDEMSSMLLRGLLYEVTTHELHTVAKHTIADTKSNQDAQKSEKLKSAVAVQICDAFLDRVITTETKVVVKQVYEQAQAEKIERLEGIRRDFERMRLHKLFNRWRKLHQCHRRMTLSMQAFPPCDSSKTDLQRVTDLCSKRRLNQQSVRSSLGLGTTYGVIKNQLLNNLELYNVQQSMKKQRILAWRAFNLPSAIRRLYGPSDSQVCTGSTGRSKFWKLITSFSQSSVSTVQYRWLKSKLSLGRTPSVDPIGPLEDGKTQLWSLYSFDVDARRKMKIHVCNKATIGYVNNDETIEFRHHLLGTTGIIFTVDLSVLHSSGYDKRFWRECRLRYEQLISLLPSISQPTVIILVFYNKLRPTPSVQTLTEKLGLVSFKSCRRIFKCLDTDRIGDLGKAEEILEECIDFCVNNFPPGPRIRSQELMVFLEENLTQRYFYLVRSNMKLLKQTDLPHQRPHVLIKFYNETLLSLQSVVTSRLLMETSWPVLEFALAPGKINCDKNWNTDECFQKLEKLFLDLALPEFPDDLSGGVDWHEAVILTMAYVTSVDPTRLALTLVSRISDTLEQLKTKYELDCTRDHGVNGCLPDVEHIPWTYIVEACIDHRLTQLSSEDGVLLALPTVHYIQDSLQKLNIPSMWCNVETETTHNIQKYNGLLSQLTQEEVDYRTWVRDQCQDETVSNQQSQVIETTQVLKTESVRSLLAEETSYLLQDAISVEKEKYREFESKLNHWLSVDYSDITTDPIKEDFTDSMGEIDTLGCTGALSSLEEKLILLQRSINQEKRINVIEKSRVDAVLALL